MRVKKKSNTTSSSSTRRGSLAAAKAPVPSPVSSATSSSTTSPDAVMTAASSSASSSPGAVMVAPPASHVAQGSQAPQRRSVIPSSTAALQLEPPPPPPQIPSFHHAPRFRPQHSIDVTYSKETHTGHTPRSEHAVQHGNEFSMPGPHANAATLPLQHTLVGGVSEFPHGEAGGVAREFEYQDMASPNYSAPTTSGREGQAWGQMYHPPVPGATAPNPHLSSGQRTGGGGIFVGRGAGNCRVSDVGYIKTLPSSSSTDMGDDEWTPQDSSYGAACPVCGCVPKRIRRMIESSLIILGVFFFVATIVRLLTPLTDFHSTHSSSSGSESGKMTDDDYYIEYSKHDDGGAVDDVVLDDVIVDDAAVDDAIIDDEEAAELDDYAAALADDDKEDADDYLNYRDDDAVGALYDDENDYDDAVAENQNDDGAQKNGDDDGVANNANNGGNGNRRQRQLQRQRRLLRPRDRLGMLREVLDLRFASDVHLQHVTVLGDDGLNFS